MVIQLLRAKVKPSDLAKCLTFMMLRGDRAEDFDIVMKLIKAGVNVQHLQRCAQFFVARGNLDEDPDAVIALINAGVNAELPNVLDLITTNGNRPQDYNLIAEFSKSGAKHADLKTMLEFLANENDSASALELVRALFKDGTN